jgi:hypothetical protein
LFGYQPAATAFGQSPVHQHDHQHQHQWGNDAFSMNGMGNQNGMMQMQQQLMAALMMQSLIQMLVEYFSQGMGGQNGGGQSSNAGSLNGGGNWSGGGRPTSWGPRGNGAATPRGNTGGAHAGHDHGHTDGPRSQNQTGIPNGLRQNAANGARVVREMGFTGTIGGIGHRSGASDHPHGNAIDVMTNNNRAQGRQIAEHFRQNHEQLGVKYVIFEQMIASPRNNWQWRRMEDRGSPTANHMDHPHISFH